MNEKIEQHFHDEIWKVANEAASVERAVEGARKIMQDIKDMSISRVSLELAADYWLSTYGE